VKLFFDVILGFRQESQSTYNKVRKKSIRKKLLIRYSLKNEKPNSHILPNKCVAAMFGSKPKNAFLAIKRDPIQHDIK